MPTRKTIDAIVLKIFISAVDHFDRFKIADFYDHSGTHDPQSTNDIIDLPPLASCTS